MPRLLVTGANGNIGKRLLQSLARTHAGYELRALVRSERAKLSLLKLGAAQAVEVVVGDYEDPDQVAQAVSGCAAVVHLVGIIKESKHNSFHRAHVTTSQVLASAAAHAGVEQIVYLSILGAHPDSRNAALASKANAEQHLLSGQPAAKILRVPMVLGEGDYASAALIGRAHKAVNWVLRAASLEQPIYVGDVVNAIVGALALPQQDLVLDLAGPESLPRRELIERTAQRLNRRTRVVSIPIGLGYSLAFVLEQLMAQPPVTRAMLGVLDHDDEVDPSAALETLGLTLTPLDQALEHCVAAFVEARGANKSP